MPVARRVALFVVVLVLLPAAAAAGWLWVSASRSNVGELTFAQPLAIPPLLDGTSAVEGQRSFDLRTQTGQSTPLPGKVTATWGVNGAHLGPTLRMRRGEQVTVHVRNDLPEATTVHWHGMLLPATSDGGPHQTIEPGATWSPSWRVDQPAATLWYHPHPHGRTATHVYRGVAGLIYVRDEQTPHGLPNTYGVDDIPLILQDKNFTDDGQLDLAGVGFGGQHITGLLGDRILVNGTYDPYVRVSATHTRFRILNASNARVYDIGFTDGRRFAVVGTDDGLLPAPQPATRVRLSPGERVEVVATFSPGERTVLRSYPPDLGANPLYQRLAGGDDTFDLVQMRAADTLRDNPDLPVALAGPPDIVAGPEAPQRTLDLGDFTINGRTFDHHRIDLRVRTGVNEVWRIRNTQGLPHNVHLHNAAFQVLDVDGRPPPAWQRGHKDTVFVPPGTTVRLAVMFGPYPDRDTPYLIHCHLLAHEDAGMMAQFVVVAAGGRGPAAAGTDGPIDVRNPRAPAHADGHARLRD